MIFRLLFGTLFFTPIGWAVLLFVPFLILLTSKVRSEIEAETSDEAQKPVFQKRAETLGIVIKVYAGALGFLFAGIIVFAYFNLGNEYFVILSLMLNILDDCQLLDLDAGYFGLIIGVLLINPIGWLITLSAPLLILFIGKRCTERRSYKADETQKLICSKRMEAINTAVRYYICLAVCILIFFFLQVLPALFHV